MMKLSSSTQRDHQIPEAVALDGLPQEGDYVIKEENSNFGLKIR